MSTNSNVRATFTVAELNSLRTQFAAIQTVNPRHLPRFRKMFAECSAEALKQLAEANIKFVSKLAINACLRRGLTI